MADLARTAVKDCLPLNLAQSLLPGLKQGIMPPDSIVLDPANEATFARLRLLAGPHSTFELTSIVKSSILEAWLELYGLRKEDLSTKDLTAIEFVMGGMIGLLGSDACFDANAHPLQSIWASPIVAAALGSVPGLFQSTADRLAAG